MEQIAKKLIDADNKYYNGQDSGLDDIEYDKLREKLWKLNPNHSYFKNGKDNAHDNIEDTPDTIALPYYMGGLNKIKEENEVDKWFNQRKHNEFIISDKLDGVSCLIVYKNGNLQGAYKRHKALKGNNIIDLAKSVPGIPSNVPSNIIAIRGEIIMKKDQFQNFLKDKKTQRSDSILSNIAGILLKGDKSSLHYLQFVAYEIIDPDYKPSEQMEILKNIKEIEPVHNIKVNDITFNFLKNYLTKRMEEGVSQYEIDGLVISEDAIHKRVHGKNPANTVAFKDNSLMESKHSKVIDIEWNISKNGIIVPTVKIEPVKLRGAMVRRVTGINAKHIEENKIGKDAIVEVIRSGAVIPKIIGIIKPSKEKSLLPTTLEWTWDENKVHIVMKQEYKNNDPVFIAKNIANFYEKIGAEGIREKIALKLIEETNVKTIPEVLKLTKTQLKDFGEKRIQLILDSNKIAKNASCIQLLVALNIFQGKLSFKRLEPMIKVVDPLKNYTQDMTQTLIEIKGVSNASAKLYLDGIKTFKEFIKETGLSCKSKSKSNIETDNRFESQVFLFSGVRDKQVEECIKLFGGKVVERFTKSEKVTTLVVKDTNASTSKIQQAKNENIQIISIEDMRKKCLK